MEARSISSWLKLGDAAQAVARDGRCRLSHVLERDAVAHLNLELYGLRRVDRLSDSADQHARRPATSAHVATMLVGDLVRHDAVRLAHVADDVLAGGGFERHRPARRDQPANPVAAAGLTIISGFGRRSGDGQIDASGVEVVGGVHRDVDVRAVGAAPRARRDRAIARFGVDVVRRARAHADRRWRRRW